jgi:hypothetical protein
VHEWRPTRGKPEREVFLLAAEDAQGERAGVPKEFVERCLLADRDPVSGGSRTGRSEEIVTPMRSPSWSTASTATLWGTNRIRARRSSPLVTCRV